MRIALHYDAALEYYPRNRRETAEIDSLPSCFSVDLEVPLPVNVA
jgi:hypothetical protein